MQLTRPSLILFSMQNRCVESPALNRHLAMSFLSALVLETSSRDTRVDSPVQLWPPVRQRMLQVSWWVLDDMVPRLIVYISHSRGRFTYGIAHLNLQPSISGGHLGIQ